jgi:hypothetical protein
MKGGEVDGVDGVGGGRRPERSGPGNKKRPFSFRLHGSETR